MDKVYTLEEALNWFLYHSKVKSVICVHDKTGVELECDCYPRAEMFYHSTGEEKVDG